MNQPRKIDVYRLVIQMWNRFHAKNLPVADVEVDRDRGTYWVEVLSDPRFSVEIRAEGWRIYHNDQPLTDGGLLEGPDAEIFKIIEAVMQTI